MKDYFNRNDYNEEAKKYPLLGALAVWTIHNGRVNTEKLNETLDELNIPKALLQKETDKACFQSAVEEVAKNYGGFAKKVLDDAGNCVYKVINDSVDKENQVVRFHQHTTISYNKEHKIVSGEGRNDIVEDVLLKFEQHRNSTPDSKIRILFTNYLKSEGAVNYRPSGGVYFVPDYSVEVLENLARLAKELNIGQVLPLYITDNAVHKHTVSESAKEDLKGQLLQISKEVAAVTSRVSSLTSASERAKAVKGLFEKYNKLLEGEQLQQELLELYQAVEQEISDKITEIEMEKSSK